MMSVLKFSSRVFAVALFLVSSLSLFASTAEADFGERECFRMVEEEVGRYGLYFEQMQCPRPDFPVKTEVPAADVTVSESQLPVGEDQPESDTKQNDRAVPPVSGLQPSVDAVVETDAGNEPKEPEEPVDGRIVSGFSFTVSDNYYTLKFSFAGKDYSIVCEKDSDILRRELREYLDSECGASFYVGENYVYNIYKNIIAAKGDFRRGDILTLHSLDGRKGSYIVSHSQKLNEEEYIHHLRPLKSEHVFYNAKLEKKPVDLIADLSYTLAFRGAMRHIIDIDVKIPFLYPVFMKAGMRFGLSGKTKEIGGLIGAECKIPVDYIFASRTSLNLYADFNFHLGKSLQTKNLIYGPDISVGANWYFLHDLSLKAGCRFLMQFEKNSPKSYQIGPVISIEYVF